jgi:putative transposase
VSCRVEEPVLTSGEPDSDGIGVDVGIKETASISNHQVFSNINKASRVKKLKRRLKQEQRKFSRRINYRKKVKSATVKFANLDKQRIKVQKTYYRLDCVRKDYTNKIVYALVMTKPVYITIEDLNILGMVKNKHLLHFCVGFQ